MANKKLTRTDYRKKYFKKYENEKNKYYCVYCGKPFPKEKITIDHIFPQSKIEKISGWSTFLLGMVSGYFILQESYLVAIIFFLLAILFPVTAEEYKHSYFNLAPSCWGCNQSKSDSVDKRIFLAQFTRYSVFRIPYFFIRNVLRILFFPVRILFKTIKFLSWIIFG